MKDDIRVQEALTFLRSKGYRLNKVLEYDEDVLYLVKREDGKGKISFSTRRSQNTTHKKTKVKEIERAKLVLSELKWEAL
jgi:hypothetical protein